LKLNGAAICTIAFENYLPFVHVLTDSLIAHDPGLPFFALLITEEGEPPGSRVPANLNILRMEDLSIPEADARPRFYDRKQLSASLKPALLKHLLKQGYASVIFLDPDMLVTASLSQVIATVAGHSLTLTPHILRPVEADSISGLEKDLLRTGMFNAGFIGVSATPETLQFLDWWDKRLAEYCLNQPKSGMHYDQRWLDHAVGFVNDLHVLRDPGVNAAYWNLIDREVVFDGQQYLIDGSLLKCIHFSGFDPGILPQATCYSREIDITQLGALPALFYQYGESLTAQGWAGRSGIAVSNKTFARYSEGYFECALTSAEIYDLGKIETKQKGAFARPTIMDGKFTLVSALSAAGIRKRLGWSDEESWGVWSRGMYSDLLIPVPEALHDDILISFLVQGFVPRQHPLQEVDVFLNGDFVAGWALNKTYMPVFHTIRASQEACVNGTLVVGFQMRNPVSPFALGISDDQRVLGIRLQGIKVEALSQYKNDRFKLRVTVTIIRITAKLKAWLRDLSHSIRPI